MERNRCNLMVLIKLKYQEVILLKVEIKLVKRGYVKKTAVIDFKNISTQLITVLIKARIKKSPTNLKTNLQLSHVLKMIRKLIIDKIQLRMAVKQLYKIKP